MIDLQEVLTKHINVLQGELKDNEELLLVLKKRLTKKELKAFFGIEEQTHTQELLSQLKCDEQRLQKLYEEAIWKINQERIKQELVQ